MAGGADQGEKNTWLALVSGCTIDQIGNEDQCDGTGCEGLLCGGFRRRWRRKTERRCQAARTTTMVSEVMVMRQGVMRFQTVS